MSRIAIPAFAETAQDSYKATEECTEMELVTAIALEEQNENNATRLDQLRNLHETLSPVFAKSPDLTVGEALAKLKQK